MFMLQSYLLLLPPVLLTLMDLLQLLHLNPHLFVPVLSKTRSNLIQYLLGSPVAVELLGGLILVILQDLNFFSICLIISTILWPHLLWVRS